MAEQIIYAGEYPHLPDTWEIHTQKDNGAKHLILMPKAALDFRAAEYGIDPTDVDQLLDILLHERLIPTQEDEKFSPELKAAALPWLFETTNTDDARKYHLQRIRKAKVQFQIKGNKVLDPIRRGHIPDKKLIGQAAQQVDLVRWFNNYGDLPPIPARAAEPVKAIPFVQTGIMDDQVNSPADSISSTTLTISAGN